MNSLVIRYHFFMLFCLFSFVMQAQEIDSLALDTNVLSSTPELQGPIAIRLDAKDLEARKGDLLANNVYVKNNTKEIKRFYVDVALPASWKYFGANRLFTVSPGQEVIVPLRVLPTRLMGSTKFVVNVFLFDEEDKQLSSEFFFVQSFKNVDWDVSVEQGNSIYFKNGENTAEFDVNILNKGNYEQDLLMTLVGTRKDFVLRDTADKEVINPKYSLSLKSMEDTSFSYSIETQLEERNIRTISLQEHRPNTFMDDKTYSLFVNTSEAKLSGANLSRKGQKLDFKKLSNDKEVSLHPGPVLPMIVDANVQNVLTNNTFMNLVLRGFQTYDNGANLVYFNQFTFSSQFISSAILNNSSNYVGYFHKNFTAEAGNVAGVNFGMPAVGRGLKGSYRVYKDHWVGGYYIRHPRLFQPPQIDNIGAFYQYNGTGRIRGNAGWAQSVDNIRNRTANLVNGRISAKIARGHTVSLLGAFSVRNSQNPQSGLIESRNGFIIGANYSGRYFNKKLSTNISGRYQNPTFGLADNEKRIMNSVLQYRTGQKSNIFFNSTLNENIFTLRNADGSPRGINNFIFYNLLGRSIGTDVGTFQYYAYYNVLSLQSKRIESPGLGVRYSNYIFDRNILWTSDFRAGYDKAQFLPDLPRYFVFRANSLVRWRTFNFVGGYFYGPNSPAAVENMLASRINPIYLRLGLGHQHLFANTHFVLQNNINYTYQNQASSHRIGYFPELFYFTSDGWRFSANLNYSLSTRRFDQSFPQFGSVQNIENLGERTTGQNFQVGVSLRKEFGIPIPFTKQRNFTQKFIAFYDLNGNSIQDKSEPAIENVVIRLGQHEVITNINGEATMRNVPGNAYGYVVFNLEELPGWFPNIDDSLGVMEDATQFIPFVKGVKIYGEVLVDRQRLSEKLNKELDLSDIKISAISDKRDYHSLTDSKGAFEFYLPNGVYTISMDESILGANYLLVRNNFNVKMESGVEGMYISFNIQERRRSVKSKKFGGANNLLQPGANETENQEAAPVRLPRIQQNSEGEQAVPNQEMNGEQPKTELKNAASGQAPRDFNGNQSDQTPENAGVKDEEQESADTEGAGEGNQSQLKPDNQEGIDAAGNPLGGTSTGRKGQDQNLGMSPELREAEKNLPKRFIEPPIDALTANDDIMSIPNPDPEKIKYVVNFGTFVDKVPSSVVNHIIEMGYSNHVVPNQDTLKFMSLPVSSEEEALGILNRAVNSGFGEPAPQMQGEYDGRQLTLDQTRILHDRARKNREEE